MKNRSGRAIAVARENKSKLILRSAIISALTGLALVWGMSPSPAQDMQRYSMEKTDSGIIRLDRQTGEFALCKEQAGKVECAETKPAQLSNDERTLLLEKQVADLTARIAQLEKTGVANSTLPSEEEFEKGLGYMERFMRSFMGVAKSLDEPAATPNRT
ncbi:hypothetical protein HBA92_07665 [Ochrobactrum sp. MR28]|uniref:hypothetical protein n=1 Tax=Pseudochrobactrum asaccharolyticum TaxID=354351 RepID=UPI0040420C8F|nr:hypothetical protein [Ochrobactrum sp. MR28]MBX8817153.1 hypothetical protein [Ochrobactrum sp. MR31]